MSEVNSVEDTMNGELALNFNALLEGEKRFNDVEFEVLSQTTLEALSKSGRVTTEIEGTLVKICMSS